MAGQASLRGSLISFGEQPLPSGNRRRIGGGWQPVWIRKYIGRGITGASRDYR